SGIIYRRALTNFNGEPAHGKTLFTLLAATEELHAGGAFAVLDYEGTPHTFVERMRSLGIDDEILLDETRVAYHNIAGQTRWRKVEALTAEITDMHAGLVVIDAMLPALVRNGYDDNSNTDLARFYDTIARPLAETGAAVGAVDHL